MDDRNHYIALGNNLTIRFYLLYNKPMLEENVAKIKGVKSNLNNNSPAMVLEKLVKCLKLEQYYQKGKFKKIVKIYSDIEECIFVWLAYSPNSASNQNTSGMNKLDVIGG